MITDRKLTDSSFAATAVEGLEDHPQISAQELKQRFDANVTDVMAPAFNAMIDDLGKTDDGGSGADNIGCTPVGGGSAETVQGALEEINGNIPSIAGLMPDDGWINFPYTCVYLTATTFKIVDTDVTTILRYGVKYRVTQSSTVKYFYVQSSTFSTDTTVTVTGEVDLADDDMETPKYSIADIPAGFKKGELWYKARVKCTTAQSIANGTDSVKVQFDSEDIDTNGNYDTGAYEYTAPVSGYYQVCAYVPIATANAAYQSFLTFYINGASYRGTRYVSNRGSVSTEGLVGAITMYCAKGSKIYCGMYQNSGAAKALEANGPWMTIQFLHV